jgi:hypothetical protein
MAGTIGKDICAGCGERLTDGDHHCDEKRESRIEAHRRNGHDPGRQAARSFACRLQEAQDMMHSTD